MNETDFKVGDVIMGGNDITGVVTRIFGNIIYILWSDGSCGLFKGHTCSLTKTNEQLPDLENKVLSRLKEVRDERIYQR